MITPRATRLVRVPDLAAFRDATAALACEGDPLAARDRLVLVPTRAAAAHFLRAIERRYLRRAGAVLFPEVVTRDELYDRLAARLPTPPRLLDAFEREALLAVACRAAAEAGFAPPFRLRPALIAEMLRFYDEVRRCRNDVASFARRALEALEPGAESDRGAARLVQQTRFLAAAFSAFEECSLRTGGVDEHGLRAMLLATASPRPWRHLVVTVRDCAADPRGLWSADCDLLARLPGLERIDLVVTEATLAGAFHHRLRDLFPGIDECRWPGEEPRPAPALLMPARSGLAHVCRDREEEVADFARRVRRAARRGDAAPLHATALVVRHPLPYVYLARDVLRSAGVPCQMFDALPLAAEPYSAALDLVFSCVSSNFARSAIVSLLRSPHLRFGGEGRPLGDADVALLDRALAAAGYLGDAGSLERLVARWHDDEASAPMGVAAAGSVALAVVGELAPLQAALAAAEHLDTLLGFLGGHEVVPGPDERLRGRQLRARAAILGALQALRAAHAAHDDAPVEFAHVAAMVRRWIEGQTFAPRTGETGVHLVDADSAPYGDFEFVQLAGLVETEWPDRPKRNIFYSGSVLRVLGWPAEQERLEGARSAFSDLLRLPAKLVAVSRFTLEEDILVAASPFLDEVEAAAIEAVPEEQDAPARSFDWEALAYEPVRLDRLDDAAAVWARARLAAAARRNGRRPGTTKGHAATAFSISALERYQDCPFRFFAADVLWLEETPQDEPTLSPRVRGRFIHEVFERFFVEWDRRGSGAITPDMVAAARALFEEIAAPLLARLPDAEAAIERTRLFGSAIAVGVADVVLGIEASRPVAVIDRWIEHRLEGEFTLGSPDRRVALRGVADRVDLLGGRRLRVIDYKSGYAPNPRRALQVPVYALAAAERLEARDGHAWTVDEAAYVAFAGRRALVPVIRAGTPEPSAILAAARTRLFDAVDAIGRGEFPPRPHDPVICTYCAYAAICRKDYVGDD